MNITGKQLFFLIETLTDTLKLEQGWDWIFKHPKYQREKFYQDLLKSLITSDQELTIEDEQFFIKKLIGLEE